MTDLVVLSLERWDEVWRRNQYLVHGLLATDPDLRVLFVEPPDDPLHDLRSRRRPSFGSSTRQIDDRLWAYRPVKWLPRRIDPGADRRLARFMRRAATRLGMTDPLLWVNDPAASELAQVTGWRTLYDMTDDWAAASRPPAELRRIIEGEQWLLQNAASVVACSPELVRRKSGLRDGIRLVRNGVDAARYRAPAARPSDAPSGPYAVYVGTLHRDRIDVDLVESTARALAGHGHLLLVGPEAWGEADAARVRAAGAVVLGARQRDTVPAYMQHADALIVPHVVSAFTESLDPIKLYEYQAVGRPIVSTPVAGFREAPRIRLATGRDFADAVVSAVTTETQLTHAANGEALDWSARVAEFRRALTDGEQ